MELEQAIYWIAGGVGVPVIQWLKKRLDMSGKAALWLTVGVSVAVAVGALYFSDGVAVADMTPAGILAVFGQVLAAATIAYQALVAD